MKSLLNKSNTYPGQRTETISLPGKMEVNADNSRNRIFSAADLWNIQRQVKYRLGRRFI